MPTRRTARVPSIRTTATPTILQGIAVAASLDSLLLHIDRWLFDE